MSIERFFIHTVSVETYVGRTAAGESYADPVDVVGFMDQGLVTHQDGSSAVSLVERSTFFTSLDNADKLTPQSKVTFNGDTSIVTRVLRRDGGTGPLGRLSHVEVTLV